MIQLRNDALEVAFYEDKPFPCSYVHRPNSALLVKNGDVVIADGFDRFIPRGNSIFAYSRDGSERRWVLPSRFQGQNLVAEELGGEAGRPYEERTSDSIKLALRPRVPVRLSLVV